MQCPECGLSYADGVRQCPRCGRANPSLPRQTAYQPATPAQRPPAAPAKPRYEAATGSGRKGPTTALDAVYTQCAWQRPDGRWLNSREMGEMEELARQYAKLRGLETGILASLMKFGKKTGGVDQRIADIRKRVDNLGIPFGVFQAYANSLDR